MSMYRYDLPTSFYIGACCIKHYFPSDDSRIRNNEGQIFPKTFHANCQISH